MPLFNPSLLVFLLACIQPSLAAEAITTTGNFARDFIIGLVSAAAATVVFTIIICIFAQCGPRLCGRGGSEKEEWFHSGAEDAEKGHELPFVQSNMALNPAYR